MSKNTIVQASVWDDVYIVTTQDGSDTLFSRAFQATYHSIFGAVSESRHVFLHQGLIPLAGHASISILEFGFGTGLNAFLGYLFSLKHQKNVNYTGIECFPIASTVAAKLDYPGYLAHPEEREIFIRMHARNEFNSDSFHFKKIPTIEDIPGHERFDCIFFDAYAPAIQPELWEQPMFDKLYQMTSVGGLLVTYCARGEVRRRMEKAGYKIERLPGPPGKREMLRGISLL